MQHNTLENYFKTIFNMKTMNNFSIQEIEELMPWERDVYVDLIKAKLEKEE